MPINKLNYLQFLRQHYGLYITNNIFYYGKTLFKISKLKCDLLFLKSCKRENLLPNFVRFRVPSTYHRHQEAIQNCYRDILKNEIKVKRRQLSQTYRMIINLKSSFITEIDDDIMNQVFKVIHELEKEKTSSWTRAHNIKLNDLRESVIVSSTPNHVTTPISCIKKLFKTCFNYS